MSGRRIRWIDRLQEAGQGWWQALPLGPTGYGNSPYQSLSSFAGNELLISPDGLIEDGLLRASDCEGRSFPATRSITTAVIPFKHGCSKRPGATSAPASRSDLRPDLSNSAVEQAHWLDDYALFRALKAKYGGAYYLEWPAELVRREPAALTLARRELADQIEQVRFAQFLLFRQGERLKEHARAKGVRLIGDLPFFVSPDSSDVWANPELFLLDAQHRPRFVAGVPPDYFSAQGQLWGNPVYDWDALRRDRLSLVHRPPARAAGACRCRSASIISRALLRPGTSQPGHRQRKPANGCPVRAPSSSMPYRSELGALPFIAEDLGLITPDVGALRDQFRLPGTRVLQFAFDGSADNPYLPDNYVANTVVYTGTHDNATTRGWFEELPDRQRQNLWNYLKRPAGKSMRGRVGTDRIGVVVGRGCWRWPHFRIC